MIVLIRDPFPGASRAGLIVTTISTAADATSSQTPVDQGPRLPSANRSAMMPVRQAKCET